MVLLAHKLDVQGELAREGKDIISEYSLYSYIVSIDIKYPKVVLAQAKLESSHFNSKIFRENNNLFGMKLPLVRKTTAIGENRGHSVYSTWRSSVDDYKLWQNAMLHRANTQEKYLAYLQRNYAQDKNYIKQLKRMI